MLEYVFSMVCNALTSSIQFQWQALPFIYFSAPPDNSPTVPTGGGGGLGSWEGPVLGAALRAIGHERDRLLAFECHRAARMVFEEAQQAAAMGEGRDKRVATCSSVVAVVGAAHAAGIEVSSLETWEGE